jgi:SAM-dependent methyltransferase
MKMTEADLPRRRLVLALAFAPVLALAQNAKEEFQPRVGQAGKDVIWVPTPDRAVERMLQMAQVKPGDFVVDLGSGDGRTVIAAAKKFGAKSLGIEFNPEMVALSRRNAEKDGVAETAKFVEGDIFKSDFSSATVVTMYLLDDLNLALRPRLLEMKPGTRIASHDFNMGDWEPDDRSSIDDHTVYLWVVPAKVGGDWKLGVDLGGDGEPVLKISQKFQKIEGTLVAASTQLTLRNPVLSGDSIRFSLVDHRGVLREFSGRVRGGVISGSMRADGKPAGPFRARRVSAPG